MRPAVACPAFVLALCTWLAGCQPSGAPPIGVQASGSEGFVTADDGVRLHYQIIGEGSDTVIVPMEVYLADALAPLADERRLVFYDPRGRGRSDRPDLSTVSLDRQVLDLEQLRAALDIERMALIGWSGLGMEMAVYAFRYPQRVTRLVQVAPVPPRSGQLEETGGDRRAERMDLQAVQDLERRLREGEFDDTLAHFCRQYNALTLPANFADPSHASDVPDVCAFENEWPTNLSPYFGALLGSFGEYNWHSELADLEIPRLVIHGREDGIPLAGAKAWVAGYANARLIVLSPAGHFPFLERPDAFFHAVDLFLHGEWPKEAQDLG